MKMYEIEFCLRKNGKRLLTTHYDFDPSLLGENKKDGERFFRVNFLKIIKEIFERFMTQCISFDNNPESWK